MEEGRRSGEPSGIVVKNRNSSGCLIVRKKSDGVRGAGSLGSRKDFEPKKEKKRPRLVLSDSGSSDELLMSSRMRVAPETLRVCNGLSVFDKDVAEEGEFGRKRNRSENRRRNEDGLIVRNGEEIERKRSRLDVFEFDDYDGIDGDRMRRDPFDDSGVEVGGRRFLGSVPVGRSGGEREFETGSSRHVVFDKRKNMYFDRRSRFDRGDHSDKNRFEMERDGARLPRSMLREKFAGNSDEPIRLQGKNGVLKVMVNKNKKVGGSLKNYDHREAEGNKKGSMSEEIAKRNILSHPSFYSERKLSEKPGSFVRKEKNQLNLQKPLSTKKTKGSDSDSEDSDTSLKLGLKNVEARNSTKRVISEGENSPPSREKVPPARIKEGKVKRGSGTEKQKLRERIRGMLLSSGWTIDYRPRRNRDYLDAVYINPTGTAYWSIIKAYDALQKQLDDEDNEAKPSVDSSPFTPIADEVLSQLTRKTRKKIEKEMKKKQRDDGGSENAKEVTGKKTAKTKHDVESTDSGSHEEKLSSFIKQGGKSMRSKMNDNGVVSLKTKSQDSTHHLSDSIDKQSSGSNSHQLQGRKSRKLGRCTLLVRSSNKGMNSETDGFVPYSGKRTLLSWLIDSGTAQLSQKVQYMNRRRTRAMLEGWITRDGIHCGCCSKILTVSKFEIHAGSKLRQPFQNIYLDSGVSLLQCQIDAWNRQEESERIGFHSVDIDGDDPNDDTCGICADGGDLICCDSCPSTFHQNCLDILMLPLGDWHCPNCTCKFCGVANRCIAQEDDTTVCVLLTCSLCEKKFHESCIQAMDALSIDSSSSFPSFCGKKCRELFEHLQKYLGVKHELEAGFSWSLIHRTDADSDSSLRGLPQRVECNSKLAVALTVMDECFLPIVDRRSGINLIHNVLYNCGSNFNRLNYNGFYTAILERGDEIISAASIRFHGTRLAEMPFIGTRHIYRRQGMCRRLFCAIESALCSLKVEKLIIPAIAELMHTWTEVFGFNPLEESLKKEMRSLNMLVFPGTDMLQKLLLKPENIEGGTTTSTGAKQMELEGKHGITPKVANKSNMESSAGHDPREFDDTGLHDGSEINGKVAADSDSQCLDVSLNDASIMSNSLDASYELKILVLSDGTLHSDSHPGHKIAESATDGKHPSDVTHDGLAMEYKSVLDSPVEGNTQSSREGDVDDAHEINLNVAGRSVSLNDTSVMGSSLDASRDLKIPVLSEGTICSDSHSGDKFADSANDRKCVFPSDMSYDAVKMENGIVLDSPLEGNIQSSGGDEMDVDREVNVNVVCPGVSSNDSSVMGSSLDASDELKIPVSSEGTTGSGAHSGDKLTESATDRKCVFPSDDSHDALGMVNRSVLDSPLEGNNLSSGDGDIGDAHEVNVNVTSQGVSLNDTSVTSSSSDSFHELKIPVSSERNACSDPHSGDKLAESATDRKCSFPSDSSHDALGMENKSALNCPDEGNIQSPGESNMDNAHEINVNVACVEPTPSSGEIFAGIATKETDENLNNVSVSSSHGAVEGSMLNNSDPDKQITCERGNAISVASHVAPDAMHCEETILLVSVDSSGSDLRELETESGSV